ncbi:proteinase [Nocardioides baekrokdamisoli]|uniref:Proteinase n=1 Tax=Nocardioides baekrokdamisoli TaxID=1804624 RepID=A0A3G9IHN5_9ACTN|nr:alpha/beta hydrolase [Nocardioides baekrokdamisoli]BBH17712.1 proteinase [Nocardioides baekrokdamisoli]
MKKRWLIAAVVLLVVAAAAGAVARLIISTPGTASSPTVTLTPSSTPVGDSTAAPSAELASFYRQSLDWAPCRSGDFCAHLTVPMDYKRPDGATIAISLLKVPATDTAHRIGSLVVNPGGPGEPGTDFAAESAVYFGSAISARYDVVGFDPRGTGTSDPIRCLPDAQLTAMLDADPDPDTPAAGAAYQRMSEAFGRGCVSESGPLASHVSTVEAAKDMDVLRAALGEQHLTYFGASYGTKLGTTYADLFPRRVGRFVLDGAVDPKLTNYATVLAQAGGFETAMRAYVGHCVDQGDCFLGATVEAGLARIKAFVNGVQAHPLRAGSRMLTGGDAFVAVLLPMYSRASWPYADQALKAAFAGDGTDLLLFADEYAGRDGAHYVDNSMQALSAINCLDDPSAVPADKIPSLYPAFEKVSPTFAEAFAWMVNSCIGQVAKSDSPAPPIGAPGAPPIVVIGTTRDPATPYQWAVNLAHDLSSGVLITRDGDGHTGFHSGNSCVDGAVEAYLLRGVVPANGLHC